jgi:antitoxin component HigA of HigAB toxin-antitoxin module
VKRRCLAPELSAIRDDRDHAAALDELDDLMLSEPGTPPGRRFDELVLLIDDYEARRNGYLLFARGPRSTAPPSPVFDRDGTAPRRRDYG